MAKNSPSDNKLSFWRLSKNEQRIALVLLAGLLAGLILPQRIIVATSDSLEHRIFFKVPVDTARIERGDYLLFQLQREKHASFLRRGLKENNVLIKKVGCIPGDQLTRTIDGAFSCGATRLGNTLPRDSNGNMLPVFDFNGSVPPGSYFMIGTNPRSFDSRYFGLIHDDAFISKALPLW